MPSRWNNSKPDPPEMDGDISGHAASFSITHRRKRPDPPEMMNGSMSCPSRRTPSPAPEITVALAMKFPLDFSDRPIAQRFHHVTTDLGPTSRISDDETAARSLPFSPDIIGSSQWNSNHGQQQQRDVASQPESNMKETVPASPGSATTTTTTTPANTRHIWTTGSSNNNDSVPYAADNPAMERISRKRQIKSSYSLRKRPTKVSTKGNPLSSFGSSPTKPDNGGKQVDAPPRATKQTTSSGTNLVANFIIRCTPLQEPGSNFFNSNMLEYMESSPVPGIRQLMNFPQYFGQVARNGKKCCIMCGHLHPFVSRTGKETRTSMTIIPKRNKGVCTACDERIWKVLESGLIIKWCRFCRKFWPLATFGKRGTLKTCGRCRAYVNEKSRMDALRIKESTKSSALPNATGKRKKEKAGGIPQFATR